MKRKTLVIANAREKPDESPVALPFNPDEDNAPALNPAPPPHRASAESREPTEHARSVFWIETDITPQAPHILSTVEPGGAAIVLLDDEDFFLHQIVKQAPLAGRPT